MRKQKNRVLKVPVEELTKINERLLDNKKKGMNPVECIKDIVDYTGTNSFEAIKKIMEVNYARYFFKNIHDSYFSPMMGNYSYEEYEKLRIYVHMISDMKNNMRKMPFSEFDYRLKIILSKLEKTNNREVRAFLIYYKLKKIKDPKSPNETSKDEVESPNLPIPDTAREVLGQVKKSFEGAVRM